MLKTIKKLRKEVKEYKPDVIVSFLDSVSYYYIFLNSFLWHNKILISERADPFFRKGWKSKIRFLISKMTDYVVFQTEQARDFFGNTFKGKSSIISNPVVINDSMKKVLLIKSRRDFKREKIIVSVGRLSLEQKRQDILLKAFEEFSKTNKEYKLLIYGDGKDKGIIEEQIHKLNLEDKAYLMGKQDNVLEKIVNASCFVLTSDFEGIPNSLIEAMSVGIPCVSTDCSPGGAKLLINDGINGFLVERGDYMAISKKMDIIVNNQQKSKELGREAQKIIEKYSEKRIAKQWEEALYNSIEKSRII